MSLEVKEVTKGKKPKQLSKEILNVIRTTMRNNIDLTHIADNKANVLLSLNAFMLTFLIPFSIPYIEIVIKYHFGIPLVILVITNFVTIYIAALVLKPGKFNQNQEGIEKGKVHSPFFFGNFYKMTKDEYFSYIDHAMADVQNLKDYIKEDMHYIGSRLGRKMTLIRIAFNIFLTGLFLAISLAIILLIIFNGS